MRLFRREPQREPQHVSVRWEHDYGWVAVAWDDGGPEYDGWGLTRRGAIGVAVRRWRKGPRTPRPEEEWQQLR